MEQLLTAEEVARLLRVPKATLYAWRYQSKGPPAVRVGRHLRYRPGDVEEWLVGRGETTSDLNNRAPTRRVNDRPRSPWKG
jgi:excisionase family DNA binding protein